MTRVAVAHYPEGAGHATRMLAVGRALETRGASVTLAGGGPGERFVEALGYEEYVPTPVDYIGDYQGDGGLADVLTGSVPDSARRVRDFVAWLRREDPDALVTDDMFAAMAAPLARTPLYVLTHNAPGYYTDAVERWGASLLTHLQQTVARAFFYPAVWPRLPDDPSGVTRVPPVALEGTGGPAPDPADVGVLISPSTYSTELEAVAERLREAGETVTLVGGPDWETVPALLPYVRAASAVVCPGYSTAMEAAVAGTPCVLYPFTSEQRGVARFVTEGGVSGFAVAETVGEAVGVARDPPAATPMPNGAPVVAESVLGDLNGNAHPGPGR
jgi:UDP:flavonoid glycosyltransferase YjiC (YdhE family)